MNPSSELLSLIAYRMEAIAIGHLALRYAGSWDSSPSIQIYFNEQLAIEGRATTFTNGAIEAAIVHSRALLEFVGLGLAGDSELRELADVSRRKDDSAIEQFSGLRRMTVQDVIQRYPGDAQEAEAALARVIYLANKGLAHTTHSFAKGEDDARLLEIAFRGVPALLIAGFYLPLGIPVPNFQITSRTRAKQEISV